MRESALPRIKAAIEALSLNEEANREALLALAHSSEDEDSFRPAVLALPLAPELSDDELGDLDGSERNQVNGHAAFAYYSYLIAEAKMSDANKIQALKNIVDPNAKLPRDHVFYCPNLKTALKNQQGALEGRLDFDKINYWDPQSLQTLRQMAAEKYVNLKIQAISTRAHLLSLLNADSFSNLRAALNDADENQNADLKMLKFSAIDNQDVLTDEQLTQIKTLAGERSRELIWRERYDLSMQAPNASINGQPVLSEELQLASFREGYINPSEFKEIMIPLLVRSLVQGQGLDEPAILEKIEAAKKSMSFKRDVGNRANEYSIELPDKIKLMEKAVGENKIETRLTSGLDTSRENMFYYMALNLYHRFRDVMKMDLANQTLRITQLPTYRDKTGAPIEFQIFRAEFERALGRAGFSGVEYAESVEAAFTAESVTRPQSALKSIPMIEGRVAGDANDFSRVEEMESSEDDASDSALYF
jgi:hypothetical protein